ncbi:MAG: alpha/beta hydrolase [Chloroflexi bacterium]|jgi:pimeloyl-ACP methyl ester carboxylesterase|nr:alpha/beta hydrolase [Chloroflexota bacterium]
MSSLITNQGSVHYEVYGRGRPVILLHGWLESWGLWQETMDFLGDSYRTYAIDFWGFGESDKKRESFSIPDFVLLVNDFMEQLGIKHAPLVGHSMGGTVSLSVAINHPQRVSKVVVIGSPIDGSSLSVLLKLASIRTIANLVYRMMNVLKIGIRLAAPIITRESQWPAMINRDLNQVTLESFLLSISSLRQTDLTPQLAPIYQPVMGMYGDRDVIVNPNQWNLLDAYLQRVSIERFRRAGHFIMLDEPDQFKKILKEYLDSY